ITIDAVKGRLSVDLSDKDLKKRRKAWKPRKNGYTAGALWKYAELVGPAVFRGVSQARPRQGNRLLAHLRLPQSRSRRRTSCRFDTESLSEGASLLGLHHGEQFPQHDVHWRDE